MLFDKPVSVICTVFLFLLCSSEVSRFLTVKTSTEMLVDISHHDDRLAINMDLEFPRLPCGLVSMDIMDVMGTHMVNVHNSLYKKTINKKGQIIDDKKMEAEDFSSKADYEKKVEEQFSKGYGCRLIGYIVINRVPGNFHMATHSITDTVMKMEQKGYFVDFSHKINHLSFGKQDDLKVIKKEFPKIGNLNPLDGKIVYAEFTDEDAADEYGVEDDEEEEKEEWTDEDDLNEEDEEDGFEDYIIKLDEKKEENYDDGEDDGYGSDFPKPIPVAANYYLIAVPSIFTTLWGSNYAVYQLTTNS